MIFYFISWLDYNQLKGLPKRIMAFRNESEKSNVTFGTPV